MQRGRLDKEVKRKVLLKGGELFEALGVELTEEQRQVIITAQEQQAKRRACIRRWAIEHREFLNMRARAYNAANREKVNALARARYDPEKEKPRNKKRYYEITKPWRQANAEQWNAYERSRYAKNSEKKLAACRAYREAHREEINARRRARDAEKRKTSTPEQLEKARQKQRAYREAHREEINARIRRWKAAKRVAEEVQNPQGNV